MRFFTLVLWLLIYSCDDGKTPIDGETDFQKQINAQFKDASQSPLRPKDRKNFKSLDFFPVDSSFVIEADLERTPQSKWFNMKTTSDRTTEERVYGILTFKLKGQNVKLNIYQGKESLDDEGNKDYLFLPFLDDTNGEETYGGGRYIDCSIPTGKIMIIDFNKAYNPYCAYNEDYSCPIVPRENYIPVKVEAGVKKFNKN